MANKEIEQKIKEVIEVLKRENKNVLANILYKTWNMSVLSYSKSIWSYSPKNEIEPEILESLNEELQNTGYDENLIKKTLDDLIENRTLQTSAHTEIVPPSRRFCIDWISSQGLAKNRPYIIGAFSGVPFSNKSKPGRISFNNEIVNFIPKTHQDALVYETNVFPKTFEEYKKLPEKLREIILPPADNENFSYWASHSCSNILGKVLERDVVVFDINAVVARYLGKVLQNTEHPIYKLLLDSKWTNAILETFGTDIHFFYTPYETGKYTKQENLYYLDGYGYKGDHEEYPHDANVLIDGLKNRKLCPGTLLAFTIFSFLNDFQCLGSFVQVEYLTKFKELWQKLDLLPRDISHVPTDTLTTGMFPNNPNVQILDHILNNKKIPGDQNDLLGNYYLPIWDDGKFYGNKLS